MNTLQLNKKGVNGRTLNVVGLDGRSVSFPLRKPESDPISPYIKFADPVVAQICADNWGDTVGITPEQAEAVTSIGTVFSGNTDIQTFDELVKFTQVTTLVANAFKGCANLYRADLSRIKDLGGSALNSAGLLYVIMPSATTISSSAISSMPDVKGFFFGASTTTISNFAARFCTNLKSVVCIAMNPPSLGSSVFQNSPFVGIYVPLEVVERYKTTTNWSSYASRIFPISQLETDNPEFYAEIEEHL